MVIIMTKLELESLEYLEGLKDADSKEIIIEALEYRKVRALEIIAEELCKYNERAIKLKKELDGAYKL